MWILWPFAGYYYHHCKGRRTRRWVSDMLLPLAAEAAAADFLFFVSQINSRTQRQLAAKLGVFLQLLLGIASLLLAIHSSQQQHPIRYIASYSDTEYLLSWLLTTASRMRHEFPRHDTQKWMRHRLQSGVYKTVASWFSVSNHHGQPRYL